jgi:hypothetical protein
VTQVVECLPSKQETLSSNHSIAWSLKKQDVSTTKAENRRKEHFGNPAFGEVAPSSKI